MLNPDGWTDRQLPRSQVRDGDHRSAYQRDKARVLHSAAFRRLQAKTQVLGVGLSDFYRTRLTHSLEASQIGSGIAAQLASKYPQQAELLSLDANLIETLCLAHDIGHPPFGHGGEIALNYMMHRHGGFEGNAQTFRIVTRLEPYTPNNGMNLSRRTVLGLIKYPNYIDNLANFSRYPQQQTPLHASKQIKSSDWHPPKGLYMCDSDMFDWLLSPLSESDKTQFMSFDLQPGKHGRTRYKSFDCSIMELADDIAYGIHDLEDAIVMGMIRRNQFEDEVAQPISASAEGWLKDNIHSLAVKLFSDHHYERKNAIGALVNCFITAIEVQHETDGFEQPLLAYNAILPEQYRAALNVFKQFVFNRVIRKPQLQVLEYKGQQVVMSLFEAFASDPQRLLPENTCERWEQAEKQHNGMRVIADYISGMTDEFASKLYNNLFVPKNGSLNDSLSH
ncbi:anti-phage deoxyguanosine triphosphatase [Aestuariibacter salexigens]|uniref:anti-phage deoxyguanosine triphosphatase n=1 Tax=Aestuariibacter salexigens TaxID=226010 RepID=UPI0003FF37B6|nr:anti-phage deoxyguanosine triphosphatase [Aestuariibacter salexigens]